MGPAKGTSGASQGPWAGTRLTARRDGVRVCLSVCVCLSGRAWWVQSFRGADEGPEGSVPTDRRVDARRAEMGVDATCSQWPRPRAAPPSGTDGPGLAPGLPGGRAAGGQGVHQLFPVCLGKTGSLTTGCSVTSPSLTFGGPQGGVRGDGHRPRFFGRHKAWDCEPPGAGERPQWGQCLWRDSGGLPALGSRGTIVAPCLCSWGAVRAHCGAQRPSVGARKGVKTRETALCLESKWP